MEEPVNNTKRYYFIIILIFVVIFILILRYIIMFLQLSQSSQNNNSNLPSPTQIQTQQIPSIDGPSSLVSTPLPFTGAKDVEFTQTETNQIDQEAQLREIAPYNGETFVVTYNVITDQFEVTLNEPQDIARANFERWKNTNYNGIPDDRFIIK